MILTRCPYCGTTFRVTPDQLKARQGQVRCGQCRRVFDALRGLAENAAKATPAPTPREPESAREVSPPHDSGFSWTIVHPAPPGTDTADEPVSESGFSFVPTREPEAVDEPAPAMPGSFEHVADAAAESRIEPVVPDDVPAAELPNDELPPEALPEAEPESVIEPIPEAGPEPRFEPVYPDAGPPTILGLHEEPPRPGLRWPWVLGSLLALVLLAGQLLLHFRTELIAASPDTRPAFVRACDLLGCRIELPHKIDLIGIESSDLVPEERQPGTLHLTTTLRNRAQFAQAWPHLEVTLTDAQERPLLRRALAPGEYLPAQAPLADGFPSRSEQPVQLTLTAAEVPAVGYRLYVFYP